MTSTFFTDRDLGKQFPAVLESAGFLVERHGNHFEPDAPDHAWLPEVARRGWVILTHDRRIRYKVNERDAVMQNGARMFVVIGRVPYPELAAAVVGCQKRIVSFLEQHPAPFIAKIYPPSPTDVARRARPSGRVELWLSETEWRAGR